MPIVCTYRPVRSRPRLFKPKDVGRIACRVLEQGSGSQDEILAEVYRCMQDPCQKSKLLEFLDALSVFLGLIQAFLLLLRAVNFILKRLGPILRRIPRIRRLVDLLDRLLQRTQRLEDQAEVVKTGVDEVRAILEQLPD